MKGTELFLLKVYPFFRIDFKNQIDFCATYVSKSKILLLIRYLGVMKQQD